MNYHQFFLDNIKETDVVMDMGCGNGALTFDLAKKAQRVVGIDIDERNITTARKRFSANNLEYRSEDITKVAIDQRYDVIVLSNVLEHVEDRNKLLKSVRNMADKVLLRVPTINRDWITLYKKEFGVEWRLDPTHFVEYTLEGLTEEVEQAGMKIHKITVQYGEFWVVLTH